MAALPSQPPTGGKEQEEEAQVAGMQRASTARSRLEGEGRGEMMRRLGWPLVRGEMAVAQGWRGSWEVGGKGQVRLRVLGEEGESEERRSSPVSQGGRGEASSTKERELWA